MLQKGFPVVSAEGAMVWGSLPPSSRWGLVLTCAPWASPLSSCLPPHISLASRLCVSPPRGRGGSRTSSGSFRERWARVPAQLQPLREEQRGAAGGHAQPASDTGAPACSGPLSLQAEAPLQCLPLSVFRQNQGPCPGLEWWDQHLSSSPAEPTEPLLPLEASSWSHLRLSGPHPLSAELWEVTPRRLQLITLLRGFHLQL